MPRSSSSTPVSRASSSGDSRPAISPFDKTGVFKPVSRTSSSGSSKRSTPRLKTPTGQHVHSKYHPSAPAFRLAAVSEGCLSAGNSPLSRTGSFSSDVVPSFSSLPTSRVSSASGAASSAALSRTSSTDSMRACAAAVDAATQPAIDAVSRLRLALADVSVSSFAHGRVPKTKILSSLDTVDAAWQDLAQVCRWIDGTDEPGASPRQSRRSLAARLR
jgi:hypothetical protein